MILALSLSVDTKWELRRYRGRHANLLVMQKSDALSRNRCDAADALRNAMWGRVTLLTVVQPL